MASDTEDATTQSHEIRKFRCDYKNCGKSYIRHEHLTRHQLNHKGYNLKCSVCDKQFTRNDLLQRHRHRHNHDVEMNVRLPQPPESLRPRRNTTASILVSNLRQLDDHEEIAGSPLTPTSSFCSTVCPSPAFRSTNLSYPDLGNTMVPGVISGQQISFGDYQGLQSPLPRIPVCGQLLPQCSQTPSFASQSSLRLNVEPAHSYMPQLISPPDGLVQNCAISYNGEYSWLPGCVVGSDGPSEAPSQRKMSVDLGDNLPFHYVDYSAESYCAPDPYLMSSFTHATLLSKLPSEVHSQPYLQLGSLRDTLLSALDSLDTFAPILHRPSLLADNLSVPLLLVVLGYGFLTNTARSDEYSTGLQIHGIARRLLYDCDAQSSNADLMFLQAMFIHEISGTFLGDRSDHEKADTLHGQLIALARRSSFLVQESTTFGSSTPGRVRLEETWWEWVIRESTKRLAHFIFVNDVQHHVLFSHSSTMTIEDLQVALPCGKQLWEAPLLQWAALHRQMLWAEKTSIHRDLVLAFVVGDQALIQAMELDSLQQYLVIHGLLSLISTLAFRKGIDTAYRSHCGHCGHDSEIRMLAQALTMYATAIGDKAYMMETGNGFFDPFARNARVLLRIAQIELSLYGPDMEVCAGAIFSGSRAVSAERASLAWKRLIEQRLTPESTHAALDNIEELCSSSEVCGDFQAAVHAHPPRVVGHEMILAGCIYQSALLLWTYSIVAQHADRLPISTRGKYDPEISCDLQGPGQDKVRTLCERFREEASVLESLDVLKSIVTSLLIVSSERIARSRSSIEHEWRAVLLSLATCEKFA